MIFLKNIVAILFLMVSFFLSQACLAQELNKTKLYEFFQNNSDTAFIYRSMGNVPKLWIISKKADTINLYTYATKHPENNSDLIIPFNVRHRLLRRDLYDINNYPIDINHFFTPIFRNKNDLIMIWRSISSLRLNELNDDKVEGEACTNSKAFISDGNFIKIDVLTKNKIKNLNFYAPDYYEQLCPGREGRIKILKANDFFKLYFSE